MYFCKVRMNNIFYFYLLYWSIWLLSYRYLFLNTSIFLWNNSITFFLHVNNTFDFIFIYIFCIQWTLHFITIKYKIIYFDRWLLILLNFITHGHCNPICWLEIAKNKWVLPLVNWSKFGIFSGLVANNS